VATLSAVALPADARASDPPPWFGGLGITATQTTVDANDPTSQIQAIASPQIYGPIRISIYEGAKLLTYCTSSPCWVNVTIPNNSNRSYSAYVAQDAPSTGPPVNDVRASAGIVTVTNVGWQGSLTLSANRTTVDANNAGSQLTAVTDHALAGPYVISIYDGDTLIRSCPVYQWNSCWVNVTIPNNSNRSYSAYVAQDAPSTGPPVNDVRASAGIGVSNIGYRGAVSLTSAAPSVHSDGSVSVNLTADLTQTLVPPYELSIYDDTGTKLTCTSASTATLQVSAALPAEGHQRTFTAFVAQDCPAGQLPNVDVRSSSGLTFSSTAVTDSSVSGVSMGPLIALVVPLGADRIRELLLTAPGTHTLGSSVSDQALTFDATINSGKSISVALQAALLAGGGAVAGALAVYLWVELHPQPPAPDPTTDPSPPGPPPAPDPTPRPMPLDPTYQDGLTARFLQRNPQLTVQQARLAADYCTVIVQRAIAANEMPRQINGVSPCDALPIYLPGSDTPDVTAHISQSIFGTTTHPGDLAWLQLNYVSQTDKVNSRVPRNWYVNAEECVGKTSVLQCDEYPFFASAQGGPGANLQLLDGSENRRAGGMYGIFVRTCGLTSGGPIAQFQSQIGSPFLVLPMAFPGAPQTLRICGAGI
jgi:hypothetical protein